MKRFCKITSLIITIILFAIMLSAIAFADENECSHPSLGPQIPMQVTFTTSATFVAKGCMRKVPSLL